MSQPYPFLSQPGVRRDGTELDSQFYSDGVWVRWQRGKPRKMGGYRAMSQLANAPVRSLMVDSRNGINSAHYFSQWGVQRQQLSAGGSGGGLEDRTPLSFVPNPKYTWSHGIMTSSSGGSYSALLASATPDVDQIDSDAVGPIYSGNMADASTLAVVSDGSGPLQVSGGLCILQPFLFLYGSNGLIKNSEPNDFSAATGWGTTGLANEANVSGTKFVYGRSIRGGGQAPAGLFWSLDLLVRVSLNSANTTFPWQYDPLATISVLGKKAIVEHDGKFFWPGTDRFFFYNGVVQELPNQMNRNWFFEGLNFSARNKVWGTKVGAYGEIWWFYPRGDSTECNAAVIFNYAENTWYDAEKIRSAGASVETFQWPVWAGAEDSTNTTVLTVGLRLANSAPTASGSAVLNFAATTGVVDGMVAASNVDGIPPGTTVLSHTGTTVTMSANATATIATGSEITFSSMTSPFIPGDTVTGATSGATAQVVRATLQYINVKNPTGTFNNTENLTGPHGAVAVSKATPFAQELDSTYQHEYGWNKTVGQDISAIRSSFTTKNFGYSVGDPPLPQGAPPDCMTNIERIDPDFDAVGELSIVVNGRSFTNEDFRPLETQIVSPSDPFAAFTVAQERQVSVTIESNVRDGFYEQGQVIQHIDVGDERSSASMPAAE